MDKERFEKQLAFILEVDKEKNILRQSHLSGYVRQENDAEHSWHMAMMIYLLKEYANEEFGLAKADDSDEISAFINHGAGVRERLNETKDLETLTLAKMIIEVKI